MNRHLPTAIVAATGLHSLASLLDPGPIAATCFSAVMFTMCFYLGGLSLRKPATPQNLT